MLRAGEYSLAAEQARRALRIDPNRVEALRIRAVSQSYVGDPEKAGVAFRALVAHERSDERDRLEFGMFEFRRANYKDAAELLAVVEEAPERCRLDEEQLASVTNCLLSARIRQGLSAELSAGSSGSYKGRRRRQQPSRSTAPATRSKEPARPSPAPGRQQAKQPPTPAEQPPSPVVETPVLEISLRVQPPDRLTGLMGALELSAYDSIELLRDARRLACAESFDELLCLARLVGVERHSYQIETVRRVLRSFRGRVLLADEVGLGKTIEACMLLAEYRLRGMVSRALVLTPPSLVGQWKEEMETKFGISAVTSEDPLVRKQPEEFWNGPDTLVASLALARSARHRDLVARSRFDLIVVDEAHHLKNRRTEGWRLVNRLKSRFLFMVTATPVENDLVELYNLVTLLKPGQLGTLASFKKQHMVKGDGTKPRDRSRLRHLLADVMVRNTRAVADIRLPPRYATTLVVRPEPAEAELYRSLVGLVRRHHDQPRSRLLLGMLLQRAGSSPAAARSTISRLTDSAASAAGEEGGRTDPTLLRDLLPIARQAEDVETTAKMKRLVELIDSDRDKKLVFSAARPTVDQISARLRDHGVPHSLFHGGLSGPEKDRAVASFRNEDKVLVCTEVGGEGRNLQFCRTMINFDLPWNPMRIEQRIGRIHRIGQTREVQIVNLCAAGTAEEKMLEVLDRRINLFELVVGELDMILGHMRDERELPERILAVYGESRDEPGVQGGFERLGAELETARRRHETAKQLDAELFADEYEV